MKFGMVGNSWQPLIPQGQALEEVFGRLRVGSSPTSCSAFAPLSLVLLLPIGALVFHKIKALNSIKWH